MSERVTLRPPRLEDEAEFLGRVAASRELHDPWVSPPTSPESFRVYVKRMGEPAHRGFLVRLVETDEIVGVINITNIVLGPLRSAYLGYYVFSGFERRGLMREALGAAIEYAFGTLELHRLEANVQPGNRASIALVEACGFSKEGFSPRYLQIGGRWCDHERWAILAD